MGVPGPILGDYSPNWHIAMMAHYETFYAAG
jgi:hypothetical protein